MIAKLIVVVMLSFALARCGGPDLDCVRAGVSCDPVGRPVCPFGFC